MIEENFLKGHSFIHRLDPRVRIVLAVIYSIIIAICDRFEALGLAVILSVILVLSAKLAARKVLARLLPVNGFILLIWAFLPFTATGEPLFTIGPLDATIEGISLAALITLKSNAIVLAMIALIATMSVFTMGKAMGYLYFPSKIVQLFVFTYRYIHVIFSEYNSIMRTVKARGFYPRTNIHTYRTFAYLLGILIVRSYERAERVRAAMLCRGFRGKFYDLSVFSCNATDVIIFALVLLAVTGVGFVQWF